MTSQGTSNRANRPTPAVAVRIAQLVKRIGTTTVLDRISLDVATGEVLAIAGINGAGKTTLLRCLLDFCRFDQGSIEIFGRDSRQVAARESLFYLPERFVPPPTLTGGEVLSMLAGLHQRAWSTDRIAEALEQVEFPAEAIGRRCATYSKGMAQKLGLAAVVLSTKPLLILDEPMSGLDPRARRRISGVIESLHTQGTTIIFTSHSPGDCERLAERIAILERARWRFVGAPAALRDAHPGKDMETAFVECIE